MASTQYLAVLKAAYDYEPQSEDEIAIKQDQILFLLERTDDDWWKVKTRDNDENNEGGLVPAAYVEPAEPKSIVRVLYEYDATAPGELSVKEDEILRVYDEEDDWLLVQSEKEEDRIGFVPGNYVEEDDGTSVVASTTSPPATQIVVPPSPSRPTSIYVDPAERVAAASSKAQADSIVTWSISEVDKKGKKKKGTLGVGNGAIFFASESDKTPVQKWQTSDVETTRIDKSKHVYIDIGGPSPINLHFHAGSKEVAEAIVAKLGVPKQSSPPLSPPLSPGSPEPEYQEEVDEQEDTSKPKKNGVSVHFSQAPPSIISPREPSENGDAEEHHGHEETVIALYDFSADGEDELSITEGEQLVVLEKDGDEWWRCRNASGQEGVVPASYVEVSNESNGVPSHNAEDDYAQQEALHEEEERKAREAEEEQERARQKAQQEAERRTQREQQRKLEAERRAKAAAEAAEAERARKARDNEQKEKEEERRQREMERRQTNKARPTSSSGSRSPRGERTTKAADDSHRTSSSGKSRSEGRSRKAPSPSRTRIWHDRTGQFKVEAELLGFAGGKLRLHKVNGVVIEVPEEKMSAEDLKFIDNLRKKTAAQAVLSDDDEPLAVRRRSLQPEPKSTASKPAPPKKGPSIDWFEFFLSAGCDVDDCTRYATSFDRDKIDESILPDITEQTMRSLGLREGDIIRVTKAISQRTGSSNRTNETAAKDQLRRDEELARQLQEEENGGRPVPKKQSSSPAPNLFAGPGGTLKNNTRRGRPQPSKSTPPATVDLLSLTTASEQLTRGPSPSITTSPISVSSPPRASSAAPTASGFDDDAWTNRPSSTKPLAPTPPVSAARAPSAPPASSAEPASSSAPPAPPAPAVAPVQTPTKTGNGLAKTTESDVFEQLARLSALRAQSPKVASPPVTSSPAIVTSPPSYQHGLGMGPSPVPLGQMNQILTQPTGIPSMTSNPRGPFAPVPANQGLLQPLIPTQTGFNSFVPTRPASTPQFGQTQPMAPSFVSSQSTGYPGPIMTQPTGFSMSGPLLPQATGFPMSTGSPSPFGGLPVMGNVQPSLTGYGSTFGQIASPPPMPPLPSGTANNTSPANIFAQMKSGTFGQETAPQSSNKYDALRPQPTGWGVQPTGYQNGAYGGPFY